MTAIPATDQQHLRSTAKCFIKPSLAAGLTMMEVLVVVVIIGVLIGVLLPAIQTSREQARLTSCGNQLRQLWLATESYRFSYEVYPAGSMAEQLPIANFPADNHQGWILRIMPELSGGINQLSGFDYSRSVYDPVNWPVAARKTEWLLHCPSDWNSWESDHSNYVGIYDGRDVPIDKTSRGPLIANEFLTDSDFEDGLQNTVMLGEAGDSFLGLGWTSGTIDTLRTLGLPLRKLSNSNQTDYRLDTEFGWCLGDRVQSYEQFVYFVIQELAKVGQLPADAKPVNQLDLVEKEKILAGLDLYELSELITAAAEAGLEATNGANGAMGELSAEELEIDDAQLFEAIEDWEEFEDEPTFPVPLFGNTRFRTAGLSSYHISGVNVVFADGRSRVLTWNIDQNVIASLGMRNDGKPLSFAPSSGHSAP